MARDATWRKIITEAMSANDEKFSDLVSCTLDDAGLDEKFDSGFGGEEGKPFTAWSANFVYFPICYDGAEWCGSAPRNPNGVALEHQGGG